MKTKQKKRTNSKYATSQDTRTAGGGPFMLTAVTLVFSTMFSTLQCSNLIRGIHENRKSDVNN